PAQRGHHTELHVAAEGEPRQLAQPERLARFIVEHAATIVPASIGGKRPADAAAHRRTLGAHGDDEVGGGGDHGGAGELARRDQRHAGALARLGVDAASTKRSPPSKVVYRRLPLQPMIPARVRSKILARARWDPGRCFVVIPVGWLPAGRGPWQPTQRWRIRANHLRTRGRAGSASMRTYSRERPSSSRCCSKRRSGSSP